MYIKTVILALVMSALTLTGCSTTHTAQPQLDPIDFPDAPQIPVRLPSAAMEDCQPIAPPPSVSVLPSNEQSTTLISYVLTLYSGYADCLLRHQELSDWIEGRHGTTKKD